MQKILSRSSILLYVTAKRIAVYRIKEKKKWEKPQNDRNVFFRTLRFFDIRPASNTPRCVASTFDRRISNVAAEIYSNEKRVEPPSLFLFLSLSLSRSLLRATTHGSLDSDRGGIVCTGMQSVTRANTTRAVSKADFSPLRANLRI